MIVALCSPFRGHRERNEEYARRALAHSLALRETPVVPHLLYPLVLDDSRPADRSAALRCCINLIRNCNFVAAYCDYGISAGMALELEEADRCRKYIMFRSIIGWDLKAAPSAYQQANAFHKVKWQPALWDNPLPTHLPGIFGVYDGAQIS